ncbi:MAG: alpha/beta hydrolase [Dehalococcoidia bacterium]|jgi:pimeloyl-ACP methyl ester carboxylesterase|nr:alpha/beta hydrolase [Dehalococcoidia bacterium]
MPETAVNGVETHYEVSGEGTPALFVRGDVLDAAPLDRVQVITYDRRCAGASEYSIDTAYDLEDIAADGQALLTHLGIERAIIIGSSMGGMVAQQFALSFPGTVSALALLNTGPRLMFETPWGKNSSALVDRVESEGAEAVFEGERAALREPPEPPQPANPSPLAEQAAAGRKLYIEAVKGVSDEDLFRYWRGTVRNYAAFDFTSRLPEIAAIDAPKVIVHGDADSVVPFTDAEALRDGIGEIEFHAISDADHGITAYPAAQGVIRDWLTRVA